MVRPHHELQDAHELGASQRPPVAEHLVVHVLNANSGQLAENVQRIEDFLKVHQGHIQRQALPLDLHLQSRGGVAVAPSCVKENKMDAASSVLRAGHSVCHLPLRLLAR